MEFTISLLLFSHCIPESDIFFKIRACTSNTMSHDGNQRDKIVIDRQISARAIGAGDAYTHAQAPGNAIDSGCYC